MRDEIRVSTPGPEFAGTKTAGVIGLSRRRGGRKKPIRPYRRKWSPEKRHPGISLFWLSSLNDYLEINTKSKRIWSSSARNAGQEIPMMKRSSVTDAGTGYLPISRKKRRRYVQAVDGKFPIRRLFFVINAVPRCIQPRRHRSGTPAYHRQQPGLLPHHRQQPGLS